MSRRLNRRQALAGFGTLSLGAVLAACGGGGSRNNRPGTPLRLGIRVRSAGSCEPIKDAVVDIWHRDAGGVYSGFDAGEGERFLRGTQGTNADGVCQFTTIYPGWYHGRIVHIHAKVHLDRQTVLPTQRYFDDALTDQVLANEPYSAEGERSAPTPTGSSTSHWS